MVLIEIQGTNCINLVYHRQFKVDLMMVVVATGMASDDDNGLLGKY
jgi:hypothetical protein